VLEHQNYLIKNKVMKNIFILCSLFLIFTSCEKNDVKIDGDLKSYNNEKVEFAKAFVKTIENRELVKITIDECNKQFDGDRNTLCKVLFNLNISESKSSSPVLFKDIINENYSYKFKSNRNICDEFIENDSLQQIYYFLANSDTFNYKGIVILPEIDDSTVSEYILISNDGIISNISKYNDPIDNYFVLSRNERFGNEISNNSISFKSTTDDPNYNVGKPLVINAASFTSMDAKRSVEPWAYGEPEVRLTMIYGEKDHITHTFVPRTSNFMYPEQWTKRINSFSQVIKWNNNPITLPYWYFYETSFNRRLRWTEEDGSKAESEVTQEITDPKTGIKSTVKVKIEASTSEVIMADSYIDYYNPSTNCELIWGVIKFGVRF